MTGGSWSGANFIPFEGLPGTPESRTARALVKGHGRTVALAMFGDIALDNGHASPAELLRNWLDRGLVTVDGETITFNRRSLEAVAKHGER